MPEATPTRPRQGADKRESILDAAIRVFADKGFHGTRISDIAREAEIAYGLVYHYFKNKEEILDSILLERWRLFLDTVRVIADDPRHVEQKLLSIAAVILSAYRQRPEWTKVLVFEIQRSERFAGKGRMQVVSELYDLITRILQEAQARGELRAELDAEIAATVFIGSLDTIVTARVFEIGRPAGEDAATYVRLARTVVDLFLNGMGERGDRAGAGDEAGPVLGAGGA
ncbi:MAG: TetR/AcrR family transcriptional regulator [Spirochaetaceae bacterium]|nr:TetR/AcrR family transcriptional regulator [Spirochaetaceae bacterium]HPG25187.1 TetR/AcrR family transcriptional regulator [Myxococcota bacterium]